MLSTVDTPASGVDVRMRMVKIESKRIRGYSPRFFKFLGRID